jgi:hypothetical protein
LLCVFVEHLQAWVRDDIWRQMSSRACFSEQIDPHEERLHHSLHITPPSLTSGRVECILLAHRPRIFGATVPVWGVPAGNAIVANSGGGGGVCKSGGARRTRPSGAALCAEEETLAREARVRAGDTTPAPQCEAVRCQLRATETRGSRWRKGFILWAGCFIMGLRWCTKGAPHRHTYRSIRLVPDKWGSQFFRFPKMIRCRNRAGKKGTSLSSLVMRLGVSCGARVPLATKTSP